jgi:homoserine kinase
LKPVVRVYVPGSIGNVGPGLDVLGLAVAGAGDTIVARRLDRPGIRVTRSGHPSLPTTPARNTAAIAARAVLARLGLSEHHGVSLAITKGLPLSGGQGGSAASAVGGAVATNLLFGAPLSTGELMLAALEAEATVAGRHLDNIAPSLLGGLVLIRSADPLDVIRLAPPAGLHITMVHPAQQLTTKRGRSVLPSRLSRATALHQAAQVAAIVAGVATGNLEFLGRAIDDRIAEPARAPLLRGFTKAKAAALDAGALGCSISGSGPTIFAFTASRQAAAQVAKAVIAAYRSLGIRARARATVPDSRGARRI